MRTAIVTGASRGIGRAIAIALAEDEFNLVLCYATNEEGAKEAKMEAESIWTESGMDHSAITVAADLGKKDSPQLIFDRAMDTFGRVDVLINNAGVYPRTPMQELKWDDWEKLFGINLFSAFELGRLCAPGMSERRWGRIVNISSVLGHRGSMHGAHYAATKAAMVAMTKSMALELSPEGITVNAVAPGMTMTDILAPYQDWELEKRAKQLPARRIGTPEDIASAVRFIVSDEASYITGETLNVNGGADMR